MTERERILLENALDAHDRLWDWKSSVIDIWALYTATGEALRDTPHFTHFESAVAVLSELIHSNLSDEELRSIACGSTDDLRHYVVQELGVGGTNKHHF